MTQSDDAMIRDTLRAFRKKEIEPQWEALNVDDRARYLGLWNALSELGVTAAFDDGFDPASAFEIASELGASCPSLGAALISHATAGGLVTEAAGALPAALGAQQAPRLALVGSPLDVEPDAAFELSASGSQLTLSGSARVMWAYPDFVVVCAREGEALRLCLLDTTGPGVAFAPTPSSHGLSLLPFGTLTLDGARLAREQVWAWPSSGRAAALADGLVTALLSGLTDELASRAMAYALERYQGGKMIHQHDAVQQLIGPIELSRRVLRSLSMAQLSAAADKQSGDGGASTFAVELARKSGLDAVQVFGGYGYMQDYRVERYLRDANTLETFWIHADARRRAIARARFARMAS